MGNIPNYPSGTSGSDPSVCSFTYGCHASDDLINPPNGTIALTFDDGPTQYSSGLYSFMLSNGVNGKASHFMIGSNIVWLPTELQAAADQGDHIAVHTWSHPYMTLKTNTEILAELGWTMQVISDLNGGRVPAFWRPPYGDVDNRVRAIAKGVFNLSTVVWNHDTSDWAIGSTPGITEQTVEGNMTQWFTGSKSPGILMLEHELSQYTVDVFQEIWQTMNSNGWTILTVPDAFGMPWFQNAPSQNASTIASMTLVQGSPLPTNLSTASATASSINPALTMSSSTRLSAGSSTSTSSGSASASTTAKSGASAASTISLGAIVLALFAACL